VGDSFEKVAAIGIRVAEHTTMHGFALNCNNSLAAYDTIIACGISDAKTTTISNQVGFEVTPTMAADVVKQKLGQITKVTL
jgi:lipoyl(octanoyl) transferase